VKRLLATIMMFFFASAAAAAESAAYRTAIRYLDARSEVYLKFPEKNPLGIAELTRMVSIDNIKSSEVFAYANKREFAAFCATGIPYEVLTPPGLEPAAIKMSDYAGYGRRSTAPPAWDSYPTYDGYVAMMNRFAADYPSLCKVEEMGASIGNRKILSVKISDNAAQNEMEAKVFFQSAIHGDEVCGYVLMLRLIDFLLVNYAADGRVKKIVDNLEIWINPLGNPDGTYKQGDSTVLGAVRNNANNEDLNRSFPSPSGPSEAPLQPETMVYMNFSGKHRFTLSVDFHAGIDAIVYVWGCWQKDHPDRDWWASVCKEWADTAQANGPPGYFTSLNSTGYSNAFAWYMASGERMNWEHYWNQCRDVTVELAAEKLPDGPQLAALWDYQYRCFLNYLEQALYGIRGTVTDSVTGRPLDALVFVNGHDADGSHVFARLPFGDYYRPMSAGIWSLTFTAVDSATGNPDTANYFPKTISNVRVVNKQATTLDVRLLPKGAAVIAALPPAASPGFSIVQLRSGISIRSNAGRLSARIYGADGRLVRKLPGAAWDGRDEAGNLAAPGWYLALAEIDGKARTMGFIYSRK
jgi:hypothetical protein